jgi:hypothetical protein
MRTCVSLGLITIVAAACGSNSPGGGGPDAAPPDADPASPTCTITAPDDGSTTAFDVAINLMATASDPEDGTLSGASIVWRTDQQVAPLGSGNALGATLPVGVTLVTCTATDSTGRTGSASITITSRSPFAQINHPGDDETRSVANGAVPFVGVARDLEDGALTGGSLVWTSSIDGQIGTGETFNQTLSQGVHTITLTATDADSNTDSVSITLTMTP